MAEREGLIMYPKMYAHLQREREILDEPLPQEPLPTMDEVEATIQKALDMIQTVRKHGWRGA